MCTFTFHLLKHTEVSQAFARAVIVTLVAFYIGILVGLSEVTANVLRVSAVAIIYAPLSIGWYVWVNYDRRAVAEVQWRIFSATCFDVTMVGLTISIAEPVGAPLFLLYLMYFWIIMGNGLRFGKPHLDAATSVSVLSLSLVAIISPHWPLAADVTLAMIAGLVMVHVFFRLLLVRNETMGAEIATLHDDLHRARLDTNDLGLAGREAFLNEVQEAMTLLPDGGILAAIVFVFDGDDAHRLANPQSPLSKAMATRITSELRASDLATFGEENELWMCLAPRRVDDAVAVSDRVRATFAELTPNLKVKVGLATYPAFDGDAARFFVAASRNAGRDTAPANRAVHYLRVVDD